MKKEGPEANNITSKDIAKHIGVSQATVSLVLSGKAYKRVSQATQAAIIKRANELKYRPNEAAKTLRKGESKTIAFVIPDVNNPFFSAVLQGSYEAARQQGYHLVLLSIKGDKEWKDFILSSLYSRSIGG
ncbi:MAG: LacI family DNA-binding transcriptional regulator, partial [Spirochaetota bacterium]